MKTFLFSLLVAGAAFAQVVPWKAETTSIPSAQAGDPAFVFLDRPGDAGIDDAGVALVIGTDTAQTGVYTFGPGGVLEQIVPLGLVNAADARGSLLLVAQANGAVVSFEVGDGGLTRLAPLGVAVPTPGRLALTDNHDGGFEVWVDTSSTTLQHFSITRDAQPQTLSFTPQPSVVIPQVPAGLVSDDRDGRLYLSFANLGVAALELDGGLNFVISIDGGQLGPVVGGVELFPMADGGTLLFTASPSTAKIVVHQVAGQQSTFITQFALGAPDGGPTRANLMRHLALFPSGFPDFPLGALIVQDGVLANYKLVSLADVAPLVPQLVPPAAVDGGTSLDGGVRDGGSGPSGGGPGGVPGGGMPSGGVDPVATCGCTSAPLALLPAFLLLWWIRRPRS